MHKVGNRWYVYFSASLCNSDWGIVLPSLRVYALEGGTENPLSADYKISDPVLPPNYNAGMLDAVCDKPIRTHRHLLIKDARPSSILKALRIFW
jgi:GH43 family beta-xylosidase